MFRKLLLPLLVLLLITLGSLELRAQDNPGRTVSVGFTRLTVTSETGPSSTQPVLKRETAHLNGWQGDANVRVYSIGPIELSATLDIAGHYGRVAQTADFGSNPPVRPFIDNPARLHTFQFGPSASIRYGRFRPFASALVGVARLSGAGDSTTRLSALVGGGLDIDLGEYIFIRPLDIRYQYLGFRPVNQLAPTPGARDHQNGIRTGASVGFRY